jgi:hypothetical protein
MIKLFDRMLTRYLRRRGWVVFWLDIQARSCPTESCWLRLYEESQGR